MWYAHIHTHEILTLGVVLDDGVDESKAAAFAAQRPLTYAGKTREFVVTVGTEFCHHTLIFHLAIAHDKLIENLAYFIGFMDAVHSMSLCHFGNGEQCP